LGGKIINLGRLVMDDACRRYFTEPEQTFHRRYEALRAFFVGGRSAEETAAQFGYRVAALKSMISRFRAGCGKGQPPPFFFRTDEGGPQAGDAVKTNMDPSPPRRPTAAS
jgi:hypothetical protein